LLFLCQQHITWQVISTHVITRQATYVFLVMALSLILHRAIIRSAVLSCALLGSAGLYWAIELFPVARWWTLSDLAENLLLCSVWAYLYFYHKKKHHSNLLLQQLLLSYYSSHLAGLRPRAVIHAASSWQQTYLWLPLLSGCNTGVPILQPARILYYRTQATIARETALQHGTLIVWGFALLIILGVASAKQAPLPQTLLPLPLLYTYVTNGGVHLLVMCIFMVNYSQLFVWLALILPYLCYKRYLRYIHLSIAIIYFSVTCSIPLYLPLWHPKCEATMNYSTSTPGIDKLVFSAVDIFL
jgi:hypothetical protein